MNLLSSIFGGGRVTGVGQISNSKNSDFKSVQANPNANPLSEEEKLKKKKEKEDKKKKKRTNIVPTTSKPKNMASLNNKMPASNLGSLKIGLNLNSNNQMGNKKKTAASGLNYQ